jgi:hypothetical protein
VMMMMMFLDLVGMVLVVLFLVEIIEHVKCSP